MQSSCQVKNVMILDVFDSHSSTIESLDSADFHLVSVLALTLLPSKDWASFAFDACFYEIIMEICALLMRRRHNANFDRVLTWSKHRHRRRSYDLFLTLVSAIL